MAKSKKFGTFGGVFTPSILTILGVIMYLRLPWIIGQAGLLTTIGIVLLAHLISVSTGLSVSSIATDKKVKAGGTYYMISRSLGLPIGGTLGLALFVGLSFSVSLYLIGFAESFLSYWGYEVTKNNIRLTGSIILITVTIVTFISTSLAIKTQYIIMTAIVLSLASILLGDHNYTATEPLIYPIETAAPFILLFGIFFPAVTGFEAGVSMSGDLQNPKKSIPSGTISAIVLGLVVYIGLAFFFSYYISSDLLYSDSNALLKISLIPELVIAGIWGATLSSAFGSILGAPRILQATSVDKITPKFFAKGYGPLNEPRNAILLTFVIAEAGILIGELDVIARIVSMFFITTYGFLNLSCAIESWASSDFRPDFKIPKSISIIGSAAAFIVMIQLDFIAMIGATIILGALFVYLKRKELTLDTGDTWDSVWSSVVRKGLAKLNIRKTDERNWRPNIILFSGDGNKERPHLVIMGKWLSGQLGILSNFHLYEDVQSNSALKKIVSSENVYEDEEGIFTQNYNCKNVYEGIDLITRIYGFSGVEPNAVLMGWGKNTKDPKQFTRLIRNFNELDLNCFFLNYNKEREYGKYKQIDIWWRGAGNNFTLILALVRFIISDQAWREAEIRFLIISENGSVIGKAYKNLNQILDHYRITGNIKVINNEIEQRNPVDIIKTESALADLTIFGIPEVSEANTINYIESINKVTTELGTSLLVHASSYFSELNIGIKKAVTTTEVAPIDVDLPEIKSIKNITAEQILTDFNAKYENTYENLFEIIRSNTNNFNKSLFIQLKNVCEEYYKKIISVVEANESSVNKAKIISFRLEFIQRSQILHKEILKFYEEFTDSKSDAIINLLANTNGLIKEQPARLTLHHLDEYLEDAGKAGFNSKIHKSFLNLKSRLLKKPISTDVKFSKYTEQFVKKSLANYFVIYLNEIEKNSYKTLSDINNIESSILSFIDNYVLKNIPNIDSSIVKHELEKVNSGIDEFINNYRTNISNARIDFLKNNRSYLQKMLLNIESIDANFLLKKSHSLSKIERTRNENLNDYSKVFIKNSFTLFNSLKIQHDVEKIKGRGLTEIHNSENEFTSLLDEKLISQIKVASEAINNSISLSSSKLVSINLPDEINLTSIYNRITEKLQAEINKLPKEIEIPSENFSEVVSKIDFVEGDSVLIQFRKLVEYSIESEFFAAFQIHTSQAQKLIREILDEIRDIINLANFNIQEMNNEDEDQSDYSTVIRKLADRMDNSILEIKKVQDGYFSSINKSFDRAFDSLSSYSILKSSSELSSHSRELESRRVINKFSKAKNTVYNYFQNVLVLIFYKRSEGILFAKQIDSKQKDEFNPSELLLFTEKLQPKQEITSELPYYYKKLFGGSSRVNSELWVGRKKEIEMCQSAFNRFKKNGGGLLILGNRNSGKSALSKRVADLYFNPENIFNINAPLGGSYEVDDFYTILQKAMHVNSDVRSHLSRISNSVIIFNDIELWWERTENGFAVLEEIESLISLYNKQIFFIINSTTHSYSFIKKLYNLDYLFSNTVYCNAFDAEELKDIILSRHKASGLNFTLKGVDEDNLSDLKLAKLFNYYFDFSEGNVGSALTGWLANIKSINENELEIDYPKILSCNQLSRLPEDWIFCLIQFVLHRRMDLKKAKRIMNNDIESIESTFNKMLNAGLLKKREMDIYEINQVIEPYLINYFIKSEII